MFHQCFGVSCFVYPRDSNADSKNEETSLEGEEKRRRHNEDVIESSVAFYLQAIKLSRLELLNKTEQLLSFRYNFIT